MDVRAQPDVVIESPTAYVFVEAKRLRRSSFQPEQLARELLLAGLHGAGRHPVLLLVLGSPPPITVHGHGALSLEDAVDLGAELISQRHGQRIELPGVEEALAWTTWGDIDAQVKAGLETYTNADESTLRAVRRVAATIADAVQVHA